MMVPPQHGSLLTALQDPGVLGVDFTLSPDLERMFTRVFGDRIHPNFPNLDFNTPIRIQNRFNRDREIFRGINNGHPPRAVLYSIRDLNARTALYGAQRDAVRDHIDNQLTLLALGRAPNVGELTGILTTERDRLVGVGILSEPERIQLELYNHYINAGLGANNRIAELQAHLAGGGPATVTTWFANPNQTSEVDNLAHTDFYRLNIPAAIASQRDAVRDHIDNQLTLMALGRAPNVGELTGILTTERNRLAGLGRPLTFQEYTQWQLYNHYLTTGGRIAALQGHLAGGQTVATWFGDANQIAEAESVGRTNTGLAQGVATEVGQVYGPGPIHNWGMNCGWLLGLITNNVPIVSLSPVDANNQYRGHAPPLAPPPTPSAFALEMATLMTAGYAMSYNAGAITYAPTYPSTVIPLTMDGIEGHGLLQTRANQDQIYQEVMARIALGGNFANWTPPTIVAQNTVRIQALVGANPNFDAQAARHPHTRSQDLTTIAHRTNSAAVLVDIANNVSADAGVFAEILANGAIDGATRTAIASNDNADAISLTALVGRGDANLDALVAARPNTLTADLRTIAHRTNSAAVLINIARHPNADAATLTTIMNNVARTAASDSAIIANNHASGASLITIAGRTLLAADLVAIAGHPNVNAAALTAVVNNLAHNAASDSAVVGNNHTQAASLATIAGRTLIAADLHHITAHIHHNAISDAAVVANNNTAAADLATIATRTPLVTDLHNITTHVNNNAISDAAVVGNNLTQTADLVTIRARRLALQGAIDAHPNAPPLQRANKIRRIEY